MTALVLVALTVGTADGVALGADFTATEVVPVDQLVSAAATWLALEAPPDPATSPVRGCDTSPGCRPAWAIACCMEM